MPEPPRLEKAELRELDAEFEHEINRDRWMKVQINPETMKVSFANQLQQASNAGDQSGPAARQFVGAGTTKLALQLWFDVSGPVEAGRQLPDDVRRLTQKVAYYITPKPGANRNQMIPPAVRFVWGTFQFDGLMDSLEESLEFFSPDGRPLRASLSLALSQQRITEFTFRPPSGAPGASTPSGAPAAGTQPLTPAPAGATVQGLAAQQGRADDWQAIAAANGVENPRRLEPGTLLDLGAGRR